MPDLVNQMFCNTHQCQISITGCMKRQVAARKADPTRAWREYNSVPFDPKCEDCAQGKAIMKKYKDKKEELMETTSESRSHKIKSELDELEIAARKRDNAGAAEEAAPPATNPCGTVVEGKTCNHCDLVVGLDVADKYFYPSKNTKDGFETTCKECRKRMDRERREAKKASEKPGKPGRPKKSKPKKNPEKKTAASPETPVAEVVTPVAAPGNESLADKEKKAFSTSAADIINHAPRSAEQTDTIRKNDHSVDMNEMVRQVFVAAGRPHLYEALEKAAFEDIRPPHLQAVYLLACSLDPFGKCE